MNRAQRYSYRSQEYNEWYEILTLQEVIDIAKELNEEQSRKELGEYLDMNWGSIGLYIEIKSNE